LIKPVLVNKFILLLGGRLMFAPGVSSVQYGFPFVSEFLSMEKGTLVEFHGHTVLSPVRDISGGVTAQVKRRTHTGL
jgi:hypothetical protein